MKPARLRTREEWIIAAYGLAAPTEGKAYHVWFTPTTGAPVDAGKLDPATDGSAFAMMKDLPAVDQGKLLAVSLDDESAKGPGTALMSAQLPSLKPTAVAPKTAAPAAGTATPAPDKAAVAPSKP